MVNAPISTTYSQPRRPETPFLFLNNSQSPRGTISSINISATNSTVNNFYFNNPGMYNIHWTARESNEGVRVGGQNQNGVMDQEQATQEGQWSTYPVGQSRSTGSDFGRLAPGVTTGLSSITIVDVDEVSSGSPLISSSNPSLGIPGRVFPLTSSPRFVYPEVTGSRGTELPGGGDIDSGILSYPNISFHPPTT